MRAAGRGLARVLFGSEPPHGGAQRSPGQRWAARAVLGAVALLLCAASVASLASGHFLTLGGMQFPDTSRYLGPGPVHPTQVKTIRGAEIPITWIYRHVPRPPLASLPGEPFTLMVLAALAVVLPLLLVAVRHPLLGWRLGWLGLALVPLLDANWWGGLPWGPVQIVVLLIALCAAGTRHGRPVLGWLWTLTLVPWWFWAVRDGPGTVTAALGTVAFLALAVAVDSVGANRRILADQAEEAELERARRAVLEERARIARELHDVVAHHMSLMAIRAESAPHRLGALPDPVRAEFGWLSGSAREALADMRRLLSVLRSDLPAERAPQPGLTDLAVLVEAARQAGMAVELSAPPAPGQVPLSAGVCAYRIVQEALSNAGRHAAGAPVTVSVRHEADAVTLQVVNGPGVPAGSAGNGHGPGHGLAGMRERVELLGGSLSAGPAFDGGFAVSAVLPLGGAA